MSNFYHSLALPGVQALMPYQAGKPVEELQRELNLERVVKLASNENPLGASPRVLQAMADKAAEIHRYPDSNGYELKQVLSVKLGVLSEQITLGNGSNDVLNLIGKVFLSANQSAIYSQHAFIVYPLMVKAVGARAVVTVAKDYGHDLSAMLAAIDDDTRLVFIANPNNPTGTFLSAPEIEHFLAQVPEQVLVVLDEAYHEYLTVGQAVDGVRYLQRYPNLIVTRTFSKAYGIAGLRVGYAVSSSEIADLLNRVREPFNVNNLALVGAQAALQDEQHLQAGLQVNREGMVQLLTGFKQLGLVCIPSVANFITVDVGKSALPVYDALLKQGVIVRPIGVYGLPNHLRVSIGTAEENDFALTGFRQVLS